MLQYEKEEEKEEEEERVEKILMVFVVRSLGLHTHT